MAIKFGEIDAAQIIENEFRIGVLERLFEWLMKNNALRLNPSEEVILDIQSDVVKSLQKKYPNSGVGLKKEEPQPVAG
jgi:DNA polymerase III delta prime subunit